MPATVVLWTLKKNARKLTCELHEHPQGMEIVLVDMGGSGRQEMCRVPGRWRARVESWKRSALHEGWAESHPDPAVRRDSGRLGRLGGHLRRLVNHTRRA